MNVANRLDSVLCISTQSHIYEDCPSQVPETLVNSDIYVLILCRLGILMKVHYKQEDVIKYFISVLRVGNFVKLSLYIILLKQKKLFTTKKKVIC